MNWATFYKILLSHVSPSALQGPVSWKAHKLFRGQILKSKPLEYQHIPSAQTSQFCFVNW